MNKKTPLQAVIGLLLVVTLLLSACATGASRQSSADARVPERAQARWDALLAGDFETAYSYMTPGYRSANTAAQMEIEFRTRRVQYRAASYERHDCDESACTVEMEVEYRVLGALPGVSNWESETAVQERWIKSEGEWWFFPGD